MVRNLFQLCSFHSYNNENNSGGKIIQISDHKHKAEHKKQKQGSGRTQSDSLARNIKNHQNSKTPQAGHYKTLQKPNRKGKPKPSVSNIFYYVFAILSILFGLYVLFGSFLRSYK
jgi:hypothetical protein